MHPALAQRILENMGTAAVVLDDAFRVVALNPAAETLLETSVRRSAGLPFARVARGDDPSIPTLLGSFDQLVQAVLNVVRNAVQAGGDRIAVRTRVAHQAHIGRRQHSLAGRIDVIDNGPGVPPDLAESVFFPMVSGRTEGSGLGLSIAQSLVSRHGGIIEHGREAGETTFSVLLPLAAPPA